MIRHVHWWYRYGGGSAYDIFVEFGVDETTFFTRVLELLDTGHALSIHAATVQRMQKVCRSRLWLARPARPRDEVIS